MSLDVARERAAKGAVRLDAKVDNWRKMVNPDKLHMDDCFECVLGQIFGGYLKGLDQLNLGLAMSQDLGFDLRRGETHIIYKELNIAWWEQITGDEWVKPILDEPHYQ